VAAAHDGCDGSDCERLDRRHGIPGEQPATRNAYKVKLDDAAQPSWVDSRIDTKAVLKRLTAVNVLVTCTDCRPEAGLVVLDNLAFEK